MVIYSIHLVYFLWHIALICSKRGRETLKCREAGQ